MVYGMHPNAELSLLTSLGETLFHTVSQNNNQAHLALMSMSIQGNSHFSMQNLPHLDVNPPVE